MGSLWTLRVTISMSDGYEATVGRIDENPYSERRLQQMNIMIFAGVPSLAEGAPSSFPCHLSSPTFHKGFADTLDMQKLKI